MEDYKHMVRVGCITYNHAAYIKDTMDGFCMQETSFPFVCTIVDDASTDGEQKVIKKYLNEHFVLTGDDDYRCDETVDFIRIYARHKTNTNCYFLVVFLKYNHYSIKKPKGTYIKEWTNSKYVALCEGDDYWIDSHKLQKQLEWHELHPEYSLSHGDVVYYNEDTKETKGRIGKYSGKRKSKPYKSKKDIFNRIVRGKYGAITLTMFFRYDSYQEIQPNTISLMMGDAPLLLDLSQMGKVHYFTDVFGVYRIHKGSMAHGSPQNHRRFMLGISEMFIYYCNKYNYRVPFDVKFRYNMAYLAILKHDGKIQPPAQFDIFPMFGISKRMMGKQWYVSLVCNIVYPIMAIFNSGFNKLERLFLKIQN